MAQAPQRAAACRLAGEVPLWRVSGEAAAQRVGMMSALGLTLTRVLGLNQPASRNMATSIGQLLLLLGLLSVGELAC